MKKFFGFLMAAAVLFGASSCVKEDISSSLAGGEVEVTLTANLADLGTRAIGDGTSATNLYVAIYEAGTKNQLSTEIINPEQAIAVNGKTATVRVVLLKDKHYDLVFWAQSPNATCYTRNWAARNIEVVYDGAVAQDEDRDAFFGVWNNWRAGHDNTEFPLHRPFAQLNAGLSQEDVINIENNKVSVADLHAAVTVKHIANILNLDSDNAGTVSGEAEVTFASAAKPTEDLLVGSKTYNYLSMNYLLVNEKQNVDVTYTLEEVNEESEGTKYVRPYYNVPVQRNYRTNIIGNLISSPMDFTVYIVPEFYEPANNYVTTATDLQKAINSAKAGETLHIVLGDNIVGDVMAHIKPGVDIIINGENIDLGESNFKYDGTIKIHHGSNYNDGKITIKNINFETATPELNFIMPNDFGVNEDGVTCRYSQNVTVENCTFTATGEAVDTVVGVQAKSCKNLKVIGCTATNMHSLIQAQSCGGDVVVKNSTVNGKNGVAFKQVKNAVVEGCTIVAKAYGIRFDGNTDNYGITANNNSVTAVQPLIVRKMTGKNNTITLSENEFNVVDAIYQIVITKGSDDEAYVYPTGTYTITGHEGCTTYPIADKESLAAAVANPLLPVVEVEGAVENVGLGFEVKRDAVLNFNNNELNAGSDANSRWYAIEVFGNYDVAINDANFTRAGVYAEDGANVVFNNGVINHKPERSSRYIFCAQSGSTITVKDGTFNNDRPNNSYFWADNATIVVEGGNFGGSTSTKKVVLTNNGKLIIKGGTFNFDPTAWLAAGYSVVKVNGTWTVVKGENVTAATNIDSLVAAMNEGKSEIYLAAGTYTFPASDIKAGVTITCAPGTVFTGNSKLNIKGATVIGAKFSNPTGTAVDQTINGTFKNCTFEGSNALRWCYAGETVVFEDCVFSGSTYGIHFDGGANYVVFRNCTISGFNAFAAATTLVTFEGCTFVGNGKSNYNGANLWGSATMVNCEFTFNGSTGNEWIDCIGADKTYSFENCTINGVAYTAENYAEYLANIESRNEITVKINGVDCAM